MTPERWEQIKEIFQAALEREPQQRAVFLGQACAGDDDLRVEVESLLVADAETDQPVDRPALSGSAKLLSANTSPSPPAVAADLPAGHSIGPYQILRLIGRGGMGEVYLAQDKRLGRRIALKLLPVRFTSDPERVYRFRQEARAASALNHPNIVVIFDIGQDNERHFMAAEFVEGQTLREVLKCERLAALQALDIAIQIAGALEAAHQAGIIHRDIKPENLMLRPDGYVKVLDFGLAKLADPGSANSGESSEDATRDSGLPSGFETRTGMVLGTANYMSPEQARGQKVDARTDQFSLGVVLYEMLTRHRPFEGATRNHTMVAILDKEPPPLADYLASAPPGLQHLVSRVLAKDRDERYPTSKDLLACLKDLKHELEFQAELARTGQPSNQTHKHDNVPTNENPPRITESRTPPKRGLTAALIALAVLALAAVTTFFYFNRRAPLTEKDTILLADFDNRTGEAVFDGTLKQALAVQLEQSPFLNIYSDEQVRGALRYMNRSAHELVTKDVAREICQRQRLKAMLGGTISSLGSHYVITLEAVNAQTGEAIARQQAEAVSKEQVLSSLGKAATALREKLGESLHSIQKFDTPLEQATTSSWEALKAFSLGAERAIRGDYPAAIPFYKRAVEMDPDFAMAYKELSTQYNNARQIELAAEASEKAFALRARVTEREKLHIEASYYLQTTVEYDRAIEALLLLKQTYPQDVYARNTLAYCYNLTGQPENVLEEAREAIRLDPHYASPRSNLAAALACLNRFGEARAALEQMSQVQLDTPAGHCGFYVIASAQGDAAAARQQLDWLKQHSYEYFSSYLQAWTAAKAGRLRQSEDFGRLAVEQALQNNLKDLAASFAASEMLLKAGCGLCRQARQEAAAALAFSRVGLARAAVPPLPGVALALALCGEVAETHKLAGELAKRYPKATTVNAVFLPLIHAASELHRGNADRAVQLLEAATRYESAVGWWPTYVRGQAYLRLNQGAAAAAEFQKILDHPGWGPYPYSIFHAPAQLGLARAAAMSGDEVKARQAYQDFLAAWKDADADLPILLEAKREFNR
jgi:serine/threonine protein kinase/tetratricopeptide (TPR) repeat protein